MNERMTDKHLEELREELREDKEWTLDDEYDCMAEIDRLRKLETALADEALAEDAARCVDPDHDIRWCPSCSERMDAIDDYREAIAAKVVEHSCENCGNCGTPACDPPCSQCRMTHTDRWRPKPETPTKPVWPGGPYTVWPNGAFFDVCRADGEPVCGQCTQTEAEAIAQALNGYRDAIAWIRRHTGPGIPLSEWQAYLAERDALLAAADGRDMGQK